MATKKEKILKHLREHGSITPKQAYVLYGHMRLASVIHKFKEEGHFFITERKSCPDPDGGSRPITWAKYNYVVFSKSQPSLF